MNILDYIFYRWVLIYKKFTSKPHFYSSLVLSVYECLTIFNIWLTLNLILGIDLPTKEAAYLIIALSYLLNYYRYERNFSISETLEKWTNDSNSKVKLWIIIVYLVALFAYPIGLGLSKSL
jgi:hypothetical protein